MITRYPFVIFERELRAAADRDVQDGRVRRLYNPRRLSEPVSTPWLPCMIWSPGQRLSNVEKKHDLAVPLRWMATQELSGENIAATQVHGTDIDPGHQHALGALRQMLAKEPFESRAVRERQELIAISRKSASSCSSAINIRATSVVTSLCG